VSDWSTAEQDFVSDLASRPAARQPATLGEIWNSEWQAAGLGTIGGLTGPLNDAYEDLHRAVEDAAGRPVADIAAELRIPLFRARSFDERAAMLAPIIATLPEDSRKVIEPLRDIRSRAADKAAAIEHQAADTAMATYGLSGHAAAWAAGIARTAVDPVNLGLTVATAPLGGEGGAIAPFLLRQAAIRAGVQAAQEPFIQGGRAELGLESGPKQALGDILNAGTGAAGMAGLFRAGAAAWRFGASRIRGVSNVAPADFEAAANLAERDQAIAHAADVSPAPEPMAHAQSIEAASDAINAGDVERLLAERGDQLAVEGARLPPTVERLSELQLGQVRDAAVEIEARTAESRTKLDREAERIAAEQPKAEQLAAEIAPLEREVSGLQSDLAAARERLAGARQPTDPETQARLDAIGDELKAPALATKRRQALEDERETITQTLAMTAPGDAQHVASLNQETVGLERALARNQKVLDRARSAATKAQQALSDRTAALSARREALEARRASSREIIGNELRRTIARLASTGYDVRLARPDAQAFADRLLAAKDEEVPRTLGEITRALAEQKAKSGGHAEQLALRAQGLARAVGSEIPRDEALELGRHVIASGVDEGAAIVAELRRRGIVAERPVSELPLPREIGAARNEAGETVTEMLARKATTEELLAHPEISAAYAAQGERPPTNRLPGYGTAEFQADRVFTLPDGRTLKGYQAAVDHLVVGAKAFSTHGPVENRGIATIVLGPPAAGKSTFAERLARERRSALVDADEAKKIIPEYEAGAGTSAVHEESSLLSGMMLKELVREDANIVFPKVGANANSIRELIVELKGLGYRVDLVHMNVAPDEAFRRMIGRYQRTGRMIASEYFAQVGDKPAQTYYMMKKEGLAHDAVEIDANGPPGQHVITDGAGTELAKYLQSDARGGPGRSDDAVSTARTEGTAPREGQAVTPPPKPSPLGREQLARVVDKPEPPQIIDRAELIAAHADASGAVDMRKVGEDVASRVQNALDAGGEVTLVIEGKRVLIVSVTRGMVQDAEGQSWGVMPILAPTPGKVTHLEIALPAKSAEAARGRGVGRLGLEPTETDRPALGNRQLAADAGRVLDEAGGDFEIAIVEPDGSVRKISAREVIAEAEADANAARELFDCLGGAIAEAAE
jgi:adenylate kinase family enzyme/predicted  nucleic acid-binding Zn-ribbon protein